MQDSAVRLMLTGDNAVFSTHLKPFACYEKVAPTLTQADVRFANLEFPLTKEGAQLEPMKAAIYKDLGMRAWAASRVDIAYVEVLRYAGYDVVGLANNHLMDFGPAGFRQTRETLKSAGIVFCGAGENALEARRPVFVERNGVRLAFISFTTVFPPSAAATPERPGVASIKIHTSYVSPALTRIEEQPGTPIEIKTTFDSQQKEAMLQTIKDAKQQADAVICSIHWGVSAGNMTTGLLLQRVLYQTQLGRECIDAGASLIVGHHPHALQGVERYKDGVICYSLGNFIFVRGSSVPSEMHFPPETVIVDCSFTKKGIKELSFFPVRVDSEGQAEVVGLETDTGKAVLARLEEDSRALGTRFTPRNGKIYVNGSMDDRDSARSANICGA